MRDQEQDSLARVLMLPPEAPLAILQGEEDCTNVDVHGAAAVLLFSERREQVEPSIRSVFGSLAPGAALWVAYPTSRQGSLAKRSAFIDAIARCALEPAVEVALNRRWSALLVRPAAPRMAMVPRALRLARRAEAVAANRPEADHS